MQESVEELLDLAFKAERDGDRIDAIRLYRQIAEGNSGHAQYARNCLENLEELGFSEPAFLIGGESYDNLMTYQLVVEENRVSLAPLPMATAWRMMVVCNGLFLAFFAVMLYLATLQENPVWVYGAVAAIALFTCAGFDGIVFYRYKTSILRGEILTYDRLNGQITLPDRGLVFNAADDVHIECITGRLEGHSYDDLNSELNFVCLSDGEKERWNLLRSIGNTRPFGKLIKQLMQETPIPVRRV